jgi:hypothetical protein
MPPRDRLERHLHRTLSSHRDRPYNASLPQLPGLRQAHGGSNIPPLRMGVDHEIYARQRHGAQRLWELPRRRRGAPPPPRDLPPAPFGVRQIRPPPPGSRRPGTPSRQQTWSFADTLARKPRRACCSTKEAFLPPSDPDRWHTRSDADTITRKPCRAFL